MSEYVQTETSLKVRTPGEKSEAEEPFRHLLMGSPRQGTVPENTVSAEELQIRDELEAHIEEDLEREIIDDMCRLARHLQRLYQQKDSRELSSSANNYQLPLSHTANAVLSEMNIRIKLNGQCRIDITKVEQNDAAIQPKSCPNTDQFDKRQGSMKIRQSDTVYHRKQLNHPVVPWR